MNQIAKGAQHWCVQSSKNSSSSKTERGAGAKIDYSKGQKSLSEEEEKMPDKKTEASTRQTLQHSPCCSTQYSQNGNILNSFIV